MAVIKESDRWIVERDGKVRKKAKTKRGKSFLENENVWNGYFSQQEGKVRAPLSTLEDKGYILELEELTEGYFLGEKSENPTLHPQFQEAIPDLVEVLRELRETKGLRLPNDRSLSLDIRLFNLVSSPATLHWIWEVKARGYAQTAKESRDIKVQKLLDMVREGHIERMSLAHGDFTPHHIYRKGEAYYLIDAEWSSARFPMHYDVVVAATRMYTVYHSPRLAKELLAKYLDSYTGKEKDRVKRELYPLLAVRALGQTRDGILGKKELLPYIQLAREIRRGHIII